MQLRPVKLSDAPFLAEMSGTSVAFQRRWIKKNKKFRMFIAEMNRPIGWGQVTPRKMDELHWAITPKERGRGYGKKLAKMLIKKSRRPFARIMPNNFASQKVAKSVGLTWQMWV